jgi:hypothetical protein
MTTTKTFPSDLEILHKLFEAVKLYTLSAGGDGIGYIVSEKYREYADQFEAYEKQADNWFTERNNRERSVSFFNSQEGIILVKDDSDVVGFGIDIVVKIY